jgi:hypothetical protein
MGEMTQPTTTRRTAFALAAVLTLTVLTGGAAVTGLRQSTTHASPPATVVQVAQAPTPAPSHAEESD